MKREEIEARAQAVMDSWPNGIVLESGKPVVERAISAAVQSAYTAGLERAAEIAEGRQSQDTDWDVSYWNQACVNIATAIRAEKNQD